MACYRPLSAFQTDEGKIVFNVSYADSQRWRPLQLPCGKCIGCYLERSRQWAVRCMHESQLHENNCFITLTYADEFLPYQSSLHYPDFKKFCRRTVARLGPFRFFMGGEYGDQNDRPHYHACLFGLHFPDRKFFKESGSGCSVYTSDTLSELWPYGHASVGDLTFESAAYVARYVCKKIGGSNDERLLRFDENGVCYWLQPEFGRMSLRPGIGSGWWAKYGAEVLNRGNVVMRGVEMKPPRYYAKRCKDPRYDLVEQKGIDAFRPEDSTPERLQTREVVAEAKLKLKKRVL